MENLVFIFMVWAAAERMHVCIGSSWVATFASATTHKCLLRRCGWQNLKSVRLAFVTNPEHETSCYSRRPKMLSTIDRESDWNSQRTSVSLAAGRAKRVSFSSSSKQESTQEKQSLLEKEASARRMRLDQMKHRIRKTVGREERIMYLETKLSRELETNATTGGSFNQYVTDPERAELKGLLQARENYEENYDAKEFSEEHLEFKTIHNDVFARLVRWCEKNSDNKSRTDSTKVFYLDGPDGGTSSYLIHKAKLAPNQCYVANRHESTCLVLRQSGGGLLPVENVVEATASEALTKGIVGAQQGTFAHLDFTGYYFDGCAGYVPHIVNMMSAALLVLKDGEPSEQKECCPIAVGYSLLGGTKNLVQKELEVSRALTLIARSRGMKVVHALDDPSTFGLPPNVPKLGGDAGCTFTTWLILQPE